MFLVAACFIASAQTPHPWTPSKGFKGEIKSWAPPKTFTGEVGYLGSQEQIIPETTPWQPGNMQNNIEEIPLTAPYITTEPSGSKTPKKETSRAIKPNPGVFKPAVKPGPNKNTFYPPVVVPQSTQTTTSSPEPVVKDSPAAATQFNQTANPPTVPLVIPPTQYIDPVQQINR
jgi:hypothetical protein